MILGFCLVVISSRIAFMTIRVYAKPKVRQVCKIHLEDSGKRKINKYINDYEVNTGLLFG